MAAEVNGQMAIAKFAKARLYTYDVQGEYAVCGSVILTAQYAIGAGHGGPKSGHAIIVSVAVPDADVRLVIDHSVEACETCDKMDAEAQAQKETAENDEENPED